MENYRPPFAINGEMLSLCVDIAELLGNRGSLGDLDRLPQLRRVNRIRTIHSSLAIEGNLLSPEQVTGILNGKRISGPKEDILAVENADRAYELLPALDPFSLCDLLKAHAAMMQGLIEGAGRLRTTPVGVFDERGNVIHVAPSPSMVPTLMEQLFDWLKTSDTPPLIKSCVFHYEFEFIHPFIDGNGRTGRLWQTALLAKWKPVFAWIPVESLVKDHQEEYYQAIACATTKARIDPFILFMLKMIKGATERLAEEEKASSPLLSDQVAALLQVINDRPISAIELMEKLHLRSRDGFRRNYLLPALEAGLIGMTEPQKPTSRRQKYFKI